MYQRKLFLLFGASLVILILSISYFIFYDKSETIKKVELSLIATLGTSDISIGSNRLILGVQNSQRKTITANKISIDFYQEENNTSIFKFTKEGYFINWPNSKSGIFSTTVNFETSGDWLAEISPQDGEYKNQRARLVIDVKSSSSTPRIGDEIPKTNNLVAKTTEELKHITSDINPLLDLYNKSVNEILVSRDKPLLLLFATPGQCKSFTCGPQMNIIKRLHTNYNKDMYFIHIEVYDMKSGNNEGEFTKISPVIGPWNLPSEPWVFLVNTKGIITDKFESFVPQNELELSINKILNNNT